ncbi:hypothetical protein MWU76_04460 [Gelidibacter sp. F2691]|nr:hypothetical protein [Gelidibacter sp. F2691]
MKKVAVIHYMPLEFYAPVTNFLDIFSGSDNNSVSVFSTHNNKDRKVYVNSRVRRIYRYSFPGKRERRLNRIIKYLIFNFSCFFNLLRLQPNCILYYESYSAWPVYWYLRLFGEKTTLFIHYHEYTSPSEYLNGMRFVKMYHQYEKKFLYNKAHWISHTNQQRVDLFLKDIPEVDINKMKVIPNYPPCSWIIDKQAETVLDKEVLHTVYIGSLSLSNTYIKEYCDWVLTQNGRITFDIYSFNLHSDTHHYLDSLNSEHIRFYSEGVEYQNIPTILSEYQVGLILYKNYSENVIYCAPNKLFEYLACGLKVVYSDKILGIKPYNSDIVISLDFQELASTKLFNSFTFEKKNVFNNQFSAEHALKPLIIELRN